MKQNLVNFICFVYRYKQRGKDAVTANNVFFYMTYEGAVDIDKITDPVSCILFFLDIMFFWL